MLLLLICLLAPPKASEPEGWPVQLFASTGAAIGGAGLALVAGANITQDTVGEGPLKTVVTIAMPIGAGAFSPVGVLAVDAEHGSTGGAFIGSAIGGAMALGAGLLARQADGNAGLITAGVLSVVLPPVGAVIGFRF